MVPGSEGIRLPPEDEPYLFNVAVDPKLRRMGVATALVRAAEQRALAAVGGGGDEEKKQSMWLHVRQADPAAQALYARAGYVEVGRDAAATTAAAKVGGLFGGLFGGQPAASASAAPPPRPRILLKKELPLPREL
jgi:RimJ/RimL family protein N-acetyltransferase